MSVSLLNVSLKKVYCCSAECHSANNLFTDFHSAECHSAKCHSAECYGPCLAFQEPTQNLLFIKTFQKNRILNFKSFLFSYQRSSPIK
jgi:hypothetical protein